MNVWLKSHTRGILRLCSPVSSGMRPIKRMPKYTDEPIGEIEILDDFLPPPEKLVMKEEGVKVTISLSRRSVAFFKAHAARSQVPYQRMIRSLLDGYASKYEKRRGAGRSGARRREQIR